MFPPVLEHSLELLKAYKCSKVSRQYTGSEIDFAYLCVLASHLIQLRILPLRVLFI
jgi:hypothetical protein